ncbi:hypothetical protein SISNIDRAFT_343483 [Sistotremastrum niveocremeum HHB9708]|uniref:Uncharacterized protein n=1 Tax=Sistotremastrum niveocremeum HHB9708 TaxID=1314777 RepID=A0A164MKW9_9AGAM|nr:hypothetical protein SISNIDRAFT_343483 [Sistotremastrum niveocremeum HHB9708]
MTSLHMVSAQSNPYPLTHENLKELVLVPDPEDPDTTKRLRPLLQSLCLKNFPRLRFIVLANSYPTPLTVEGLETITSLPTWLGQVFQKLEDEKIPVAQLPSKMLIGYELLTYFCDFVEDP